MSEQPSAQNKQDYPRCRTCRWWAVSGLGRGDCSRISDSTLVFDPPYIEVDARDYLDVRLVTPADFGCVKHEPKP